MNAIQLGTTATTDAEHLAAMEAHKSEIEAARKLNHRLFLAHCKAADAHWDATRDHDASFKRDARKASAAVAKIILEISK